MSRSGYSDDWDDESQLWLYRQAVKKAIEGKRGQQFMRDLITALDALPVKRLIEADLEYDGEVCALGSVGKLRGIPMNGLDTHDRDEMAATFGVAPSLAAEVMFENDEGAFKRETPEQRWERMRQWAVDNLEAPR